MEKILTRYFWVFNLAVLAVAAFLTASGASEIIAGSMAELVPAPEERLRVDVRSRAARTAQSLQQERDGSDILSRNIFDSVTGPIGRGEEGDGEDAPATASDGTLPLVPCTSGEATLLATVASPGTPEWSFANITTGGKGKLVRIGDTVADRTVSGITWRYLFLKGLSDECYLDLFGDQSAPPPVRIASNQGNADFKSGIKTVSDTERIVDRALVDKMLADPTQFARSVRIRPQRENGQVVGFKLRRFGNDSPLALLGAQQGDVIKSVNGIQLTSMDQALSAYQNLRSTNKLTFSVVRDGKPVDLSINIR
ncbi:MAG: type II secretion system protein GspC [Deltaproteobacteria bacterium]|nr:type II secretion system protein GspC [Deltaproteobacteria bacterium]